MTILWTDPNRAAAFQAWLAAIAPAQGLRTDTVRLLSADASARRYFRVDAQDGSTRVLMDAPPPQDVAPFLQVGALILGAGLHAPRVLAAEPALGFLLLDDLGDIPYLAALQQAQAVQAEVIRQAPYGSGIGEGTPPEADRLMRDAIAALLQFQTRVDPATLPACDAAFLRRELDLFPEWCVGHHHGRQFTPKEQDTWERVSALLVASALAQPMVAMHRDFMPRNLMVATPNPGILDFQDAVRGPITYDIASLLRDAFISWDESVELDWAVRYWQEARKAGLPVDADFGEFWRALEWMGLQRHLKIIGIFCRLKHRDGKPAYAEDLPRFFAYATRVANRYGPLRPLLAVLEPVSGQRVESGFTF